MAANSQYGDSAPERKAFRDSQEAAFRRIIREAVNKGPFTKSERDVTLAMVNHWFHHRKGRNGFIHPGREKIAKRAKVTVKTVSRTFAVLRAAGILMPISGVFGGGNQSTRYTVNTHALLVYCGCDWVDEFRRMTGTFVPATEAKMSRSERDKMSHGIYIRSASPSHEGEA